MFRSLQRLVRRVPSLARSVSSETEFGTTQVFEIPLKSSANLKQYSMRDHFITLAEYNIWATDRLIVNGIAKLSDEQYRRDMKMFFRSVHGTLNHILLCDRLWYGRFTGYQIFISGLDQEMVSDRNQLIYDLQEAGHRWLKYIHSRTVEKLVDEMTYTDTHGILRRVNKGPILDHVFNHATHHRGQITAALAALGRPTADLDLLYFVR